MGEKGLSIALDAIIGALTQDIGKVVQSLVTLGQSVKHSKEKCADLISRVESVSGVIDLVKKDIDCNGLSSAFTEDEYKVTLGRFLETVKDCKACVERYSQKRWIVRRLFLSLKYEEEFDSLNQRLDNTAKWFDFDMQVHQTSFAYSAKAQQKEDMKGVLFQLQQIREGIRSLDENRATPDDNRVSRGHVLQVGESLAGDYILAGKLDVNVDVMLILTTSKAISKETSILKLLSDNEDIDANILRFYGTHALNSSEYLVMERPGEALRTLRDWNIEGTHGDDWRLKRMVAQEIAEGLAYAHIAGVVHKNLSSLSIYLTDDGRPKIYGFFKGRVKASPSDKMPINSMQLRWTAPEMLVRDRSDFNEKCDIFSLGVIVWELITGDTPFKELETTLKLQVGRVKNKVKLHFQGFESSVPFLVGLQQISLDCMKDNPEERPTIDSIVSRLTRLAPEEMYTISGTASDVST